MIVVSTPRAYQRGSRLANVAGVPATRFLKPVPHLNVYVIRAGEKVEINKGLAVLQNELEFPNAGRRARHILRNYRGVPANHDLRRSKFYARRYGGVSFFSVAALLELSYCPPGKNSSHPESCVSADSESMSASWMWVSSGETPPPSIATRDSYLIPLASKGSSSDERLELLKLGFVEYGSGSFSARSVPDDGAITLRGPLPPVVTESNIAGVAVGSLVLQINGRSTTDFDSTTELTRALSGATIGRAALERFGLVHEHKNT